MQTPADSSPLTLAEMIAARALASPERVALRAPGRVDLTYGDLHRALVRLRQSFRGLGLGSRDRVALVLPNGAEMAVGFLAVAGAMVCAPLNPAFRESDFAFSFEDLGVKAVVTDGDRVPEAVAAAHGLSLPVLQLAALDDRAGLFRLREAAVGKAAATGDPCADDVALVLHTSGTTARPKVVPLTQRNLCVSAASIRRWLDLVSSDSCLNVMPLFHIHGLVGALLSSLAAGASVVCTPGFRAADFPSWLRQLQPSWYTAVPTIHRAALETGAGGASEGGRLRFVRSSSAPLPPQLMDELAARFEVPVIEAWGMTEASHQIASNPLRAGAQKRGSVGLPAGAEIAVVDAAGRGLPPNAVGELVIRGEGVTRGYENNPDANAAAFAGGWLRTGDQGYVDGDGYVFLTGRLKELINRGGEKIAPREVEEALLRHAAVAQAVVFSVPHPRLGEEVGAAVVLHRGAASDADELRRAAATCLPYFKVPRRIEIVEQIPQGPTGKVRRSGLAEQLGLVGDVAAASDAPRTPLERRIAAEWSRLLRLERVGLEDDFFALGGDSLAATELMDAMAEVLGLEVPIGEFVERPTIAGLAAIGAHAVAGTPAARAEDLILLRRGGSGAPVFVPSAHDGSFWRVTRLVRHLDRSHPIYGFPAPRVEPRGPVPTAEDLARRNLAAMRRVQAAGPYHIVGPCFGGVVALEMASQLERLGEPVALLVMINSFNRAWRRLVSAEERAGVRRRHLLDRLRFHGANLRRRGPAERLAYLRDRAGLMLAHWREEGARLLFALAAATGLPRPRRLQQPAHANRWAEERYLPGVYRGPVLMVRSRAPIAGVYPLPNMGWGRALRGDVEMLDVPGEQLELWGDDRRLRQIAARIDQRLADSP